MIAEIHHKNVDSGAEDQLTGDVFGALRYLPYELFRQILIESIMPYTTRKRLNVALPTEHRDEWGRNINFWRHYESSRTEPDVVLELGDAVVLIEVKYNSGLSGDDQLLREAELLTDNYANKKKFLILLAREDCALSIYQEQQRRIPSNVMFGYISWQKLMDEIRKNADRSIICDDLTELLDKKGFGGFRGFSDMDENTMKAFDIVRAAHESVQEFISRCIALANEHGEFELAPMTGNNTFLRWSGDRDSRAWAYSDFVVVFQRRKSSGNRNKLYTGALYVLDITFWSHLYDVPTANIARFDYANISNREALISPGDHWIFHDPIFYDVIEYPDYDEGELYCGVAEVPLEKYWGLKRIMGYEIPLEQITAGNLYEKIFGTFKILADKPDCKREG